MSNSVERFEVWRQRHALIALTDDVRFLSTAEGAAFIEQIATQLAPAMMRMGWDWGFSIDRDEVVNTAIEKLCANQGRLATYAAESLEEPWKYLATCLVGWMRSLWGTRGGSLDGLEELLPAPQSFSEDHELTPLDEVVNRTFAVLQPLTPQRYHQPLLRLLGWLAANPQQRLSYEVHEKQAAHRFCPELSIEQVTAVMNVAWGARPRRAETSLMGAFLENADFQLSESGTHARALAFYKRAIRAGEKGSRTLSDWR